MTVHVKRKIPSHAFAIYRGPQFMGTVRSSSEFGARRGYATWANIPIDELRAERVK